MRTRTLFLVLVVLTLVAIPSFADDPPAGPPAELSQLAYFSGDWSCIGMAFETPFGPEHPTEADVSARMAVGGWWQHLSYDEKTTDRNPMPVHAMIVMGYDADKAQFVGNCFDSFGQHCVQYSSGWNGDELVFEGHSSMGDTGVRDTFTKIGQSRLTHLFEMQSPDGTWMKMDKETCTRKQ